jgi:hypothetical protein
MGSIKRLILSAKEAELFQSGTIEAGLVLSLMLQHSTALRKLDMG